jgi:hypothetical protein
LNDCGLISSASAMTFAELLDAYEAGRVSRIAAMRWIGCSRYAEFLAVLDYNFRAMPRGRKPLRPFRLQIMRNRLARRRPSFD